MTIRAKILGSFIFIFAFGLILGIAGLISTRMLTNLSDELYITQNASAKVENILNAHYIWRQSLTEAVLTNEPFTGSTEPTTCALGQWRNSEEAQQVTDPEIVALLQQIDAPHAYIHTQSKEVMALMEAGSLYTAQLELTNNILPRTQDVITLLTSMTARYAALNAEKSAAIVSLGNRTMTIILALIALAAIVCVLFAWKVTQSIMNPLRKMTQSAQAIAVGDLDVQVSYPVDDQIGALAKSFQSIVESTKKQMSVASALADGDLTGELIPRSEKDAMGISLGKTLVSLNDMFGEIRSATTQVSVGSKQIADGAQALAQGSTQQASAIQELSASIGEIADKTKRNADIAREAAYLSDTIKGSAEKGNTQMERMMQAVKDINDASGRIEKVIKVIDDIAFQTNILALNAAVEAARAGSAGKGFAVVAEEVRNLAAKSAEAAKDTSGLIENSIEKANLGLSIATETSTSLQEIVDGINRSAEIVAQIARSSDEQAGAIDQINTGIDQVAHVVQQNSATAEQSAAASEEMSGQSDMLENLISKFRLKSVPFTPSFSASAHTQADAFPLPAGDGKY